MQRAILDRFTAAFENGDADALAELLRKDAMLEMPPLHARHLHAARVGDLDSDASPMALGSRYATYG